MADKKVQAALNEDKEEKEYLKRKRLISIFSFLTVAILFVLLTFTVGKQLLDFVSEPEQFRIWVADQGIWGKLAFVGIMAMQVVVAIMPGEVVEIGAGYAFGAIEGMILCLIGAAIGSAVIYGITKLFGVKMVEAFISREKINSLKFINSAKKLNLMIFILFFIPGTPKDLVTYFIGLTPMKLRTFLIISSIARIPSVISSTIGGQALGMQNYTFAIVVFVITAVVSAIGLFLYHKISKGKGPNPTNSVKKKAT